uniref:GNAT family N-acetyltransferase n=1 Tax=Pedobacter schmidteae TaxID=2201271 RepID=UPI000EAF0EB9|nr:GNAT family protein [Pedobacter schmidteae]
MTINIDQNLKLELTAQKHAVGLYNAVNANRIHLSKFLSWVDGMQSPGDFMAYIKNCEALYADGKEVSFVIFLDELLVGRIGLHYLNLQNKSAAIGYWITEAAQGKGVMIRACRALIAFGFRKLGLRRIEIKAATANLKSRAVAEKLGFLQEGVLRQAELVNGEFLDLVLYAMLDNEWQTDS